VEQLCVNLEKLGYFFPFFDLKSHSLPKGKKFPPLILEAAKQCRVFVIVLSEQFLSSKWPMIELSIFHEAREAAIRRQEQPPDMLPLFFKSSVADLDDSSIEKRWMPEWIKHARKDSRIKIDKWLAAVKSVRQTNGLTLGKF
jgi:hypothetical protein